MKKLTLSVGLLAGILTSNAQDTICTMISQNKVLEFQHNPSKILNKVYISGSYYINVRKNEILVLHLYDKTEQNRQIVTTFPNNSHYSYTLPSKNDVYYSQIGPCIVEVKAIK